MAVPQPAPAVTAAANAVVLAAQYSTMNQQVITGRTSHADRQRVGPAHRTGPRRGAVYSAPTAPPLSSSRAARKQRYVLAEGLRRELQPLDHRQVGE